MRMYTNDVLNWKWPGVKCDWHRNASGDLVFDSWRHDTKKTPPTKAEMDRAAAEYLEHLENNPPPIKSNPFYGKSEEEAGRMVSDAVSLNDLRAQVSSLAVMVTFLMKDRGFK